MKILAVGDLNNKPGLLKLKVELKNLQESEKIDFTIVNAENCSSGRGLNTKDYNELKKLDIDVLTFGNHTWGKKDIFNFIDDPKIVVPANYSIACPGHGYTIVNKNGKSVCVIELIGRTNMNDVLSNNPFEKVDELLNTLEADIFVVEFHAEATAEKVAMSYHIDGRASALYGTHTHVQTADNRVTEKGLGYITDIGMTGAINSIIGMDVQASLKRFVTSLPERYKPAEGEAKLEGAVFEIDDKTNKCTKVYRIAI